MLEDDIADEVGKQLQLTLVELIALSLAAKQLAWNSYGREFLGLHRHLNQLVGEWSELQDAVAERAATIGIAPEGTPAAIVELADLRPIDPGFTEAGTAIDRICTQLWEVALRVRRRTEQLAALDHVSHAVLVDVDRRLERQLWLVRAQLPD